MSEGRRPASIVVQGLEKTSDKIRALAREGYLRAEIAEFLDIRYQHARKVMIDAGIMDGLSRGGVTPRASSPRADRSSTFTPVDVLIEAGFIQLGAWIADEKGKIALSVPAPRHAGVYAFVTNGVVRYVGFDARGVRSTDAELPCRPRPPKDQPPHQRRHP